VEQDVKIGSRLYLTTQSAPTILFFHGNGEIVADYHNLGSLYNQTGLNFWAVDYRGYGRSSGQPTCTTMMRDCHVIFDFVQNWLKEHSYSGALIVMGRSLGSASALELAANYQNQIDGLIIESGFAYTTPLLRLLGVNVDALGLTEEKGLQNLEHMRAYDNPTLIIHAERDHIIPFAEGQALYDACPAADKTLLNIPNANHNNIFQHGMSEYLAAVKTLANKVDRQL
jgi:alpha-beta hydrolase superfamily lysophospholipase